jgi:hypothetical protein
MRAGSVMIAAVAVALSAPAQALATPADIAATHAYVNADYALARASVARLGAEQARIQRFNAKLAGECPRLGAESPENEASQPVSHEVAVALWSLAYGTAAGPIASFAHTVKRLRWSNPKITRVAQRYARDLSELATLPLPNLCEDVRSWRASGFRVIPAAVVSLVQRVEAIQPSTVPARLLAPFERGTDAATAARTRLLERKLQENEWEVGQTDWLQVLDTLGLKP